MELHQPFPEDLERSIPVCFLPGIHGSSGLVPIPFIPQVFPPNQPDRFAADKRGHGPFGYHDRAVNDGDVPLLFD